MSKKVIFTKRAKKLTRRIVFTVDTEHFELNPSDGVRRFLELFSLTNGKGTFFITGEVLNGDPSIAEKILAEGHELASHGFSRTSPKLKNDGVYLADMSPGDLERELHLSKKMLTERGFPVAGFRAPALSVTPQIIQHIFNIFSYDSSITQKMLRKFRKQQLNSMSYDREVPISCIANTPVRFGSSSLMRLGRKKINMLLKVMRPTKDLVFYAHSYDLAEADATTIGSKQWKQWWYFSLCGPRQMVFFEEIFKYFIQNGYQFVTCAEYLETNN